jgi:ankyrin repeat protein
MINIYLYLKYKSLLELCKSHDENIIIKFIDKYDKYKPYEIDIDGNTPLMIAISKGFENLSLKLIDNYGILL